MIRTLYTTANKMNTQQASIDNVAHNLANVNTAGYKKSHVEFEDLFYQRTRVAKAATSTNESPIGLEVGLGTRAVATSRDFTSGSFRSTGSPLDLAIQGDGFFQITLPNGSMAYTRAGAFHRDAQGMIVSAERYALDPQIVIPQDATSVSFSKDSVVSATIPGQSASQQLGTVELATFQNPAGLTAMDGNLFQVTSASGEPQADPANTEQRGTLVQSFLEDSNVSVVEKIVNMILGQRAYEASSKVIKTADEMLTQVNNLVR